MPKLDVIPSNWNINPTVIGVKQNEPQIYIEYNIKDNQKVKHRRVRIPIRALKNNENNLSPHEIAIQLNKQYNRYLEKIAINQIERIVKLIKNKEVITKKYMRIENDNNKGRSLDFNNNQSFVLNDDEDNIYNFSTPTRSLLSLNSLQPPSFLRDNMSKSEPNISKISSQSNNKLLGSSLSLNDILDDDNNENQILSMLNNNEDKKEIDHVNLLKDDKLYDGNSNTEIEDNIENHGENDYSMNSFENDSISKKEELSNNNSKGYLIDNDNYEKSFEQDFESIEEDFEEISESELNTENSDPSEDQKEEILIESNDEIPKAITPNESEDEDDEYINEVNEVVEEVKKEENENDSKIKKKEESGKEDDFDDILISDISKNDFIINEHKNISESICDNLSIENNKIINEDLNKVSESELIARKKHMDILFMKNQIKPGDPNYQYDVQKSFSIDEDAEADWDESSESISDKLTNNIKEEREDDSSGINDNNSILELVDRDTEMKKWNKVDIDNPINKTALTSINQIINNKIVNNYDDDDDVDDNEDDDDDESESDSISEDISLKSSNEDYSDFKVDPPKFINNQRNTINIIKKSQENISKFDNYNNESGLKEINDKEIIDNSYESEIDENLSLNKKLEQIEEKEYFNNEPNYNKIFIHPQKKTLQDDSFSFLKMENLSGSNVALNIDKSKKSESINWIKQLSLNKENGNDNDGDDDDDDDDNDDDVFVDDNDIVVEEEDDDDEQHKFSSIDKIEEDVDIEIKNINIGSSIEYQSMNEGIDSIIPNLNNLVTSNKFNNIDDTNNINNNNSSLFQKKSINNIPTTNKFSNDDDSENILDLIGDTESLDSFNNDDFEFRDQDYSEDFEAGFTDENME
ncbi:hypothetical protein BCR36DRAFT_409181 [Piromyces finnis]|uniref:Centrosomal protein of 19 kDa n=1 Tax=Piromyces finnis TaxID=1754191 RepID=A0A1Y1VK26_9FUNG|nr:hypothetical protein BCR36DRAFT_409181 [Piromyces finnis]|eukprot:ORX57707.1 hypothetical protein BCR36DRAFT_409181 [Piromyces finnis]